MNSTLLKRLGISAAFIPAIPVLLYVAFSAKVHSDTGKRVLDALTSHYAPATIEVVKRQDWDLGQGDFSFGGQICFAINVHESSGQSSRRVAMVSDGDDGGWFVFAREYPSFADCLNDFDRG